MRLALCTLAAAACAVVLGGSADSARTQGGAGWDLKPVAPGQKWLRVDVQGDTLYGFRLRGTDFEVTGVKSVTASGGPAPQCSVTGTTPTLTCDGKLPGGISVFVQVKTSEAGGSYDFALLFDPEATFLLYVPSRQTAAPVPIGGSLGMTSPIAGRVTIHNASRTTFQQFEVDPVGFRVASVASTSCGVTDGAGIACQGPLPPGRTAVVRFAAEPVSGTASAVLLAEGAETGLAYVQSGDPCPDLGATVARLRAEQAVVRAHLARMARVRRARPLLAPLRRKLAALTKLIGAAGLKVEECQAGRKLASAAACDAEELAAARARGTVSGLVAALPFERRVARKVRSLRALPARTRKALSGAKKAASRRAAGLARCEASLSQR